MWAMTFRESDDKYNSLAIMIEAWKRIQEDEVVNPWQVILA